MNTTPVAEMPEALRLADKLNSLCVAEFAWPTLNEAATQLRRYHARVKELESQVAALSAAAPAAPAEPMQWDAWRLTLAEKVDEYIQADHDGEGDDEAYADLKAHILKTPFTAPQAQQPGAADATVPQVVATAPRRIYLDLGFDPAEEDAPFSELHEITWSANNASGHGVEYVRADLAARAGAQAVPSAEVQAKIDSNTWDHFGDILPTLKAISRGDWFWGANSRCKYIEIRLDTRDGDCILYDRERVRISPQQLAFQAGEGFGKMDPWPARNHVAAPAAVSAPSDLVQRCTEIIGWQRTGLLHGDALRAYAEKHWPDRHDSLQMAERDTAVEAFTLLAAAPQAPVHCARCSGSGEDPEGFYDQSRGPDGETHDGPCRSCNGSGSAPQAPAQEGGAT